MSKVTLYLQVLRVVLLLAALNSVLWHFLSEVSPSMVVVEVLFNTLRVALGLWAGWLIVARRVGKLWEAAFGGALVLLVDHPIITGTFFLSSGEIQAFAGVLISCVMFVWVAMFVGWLGGFVRLKTFGLTSSLPNE